MEAILILTYDCNFRCTYCDIYKRKEIMSDATFKQTLSFFQALDMTIDKMKFFGWEPLLEERKIRTTIEVLWESIDNYFVTTNASILTNSMIEFAQCHNLHITVSLDGDQTTTEENRKSLSGKSLYTLSLKNSMQASEYLRVNQVITSKTAYKMYDNFLFLYNMWFRSFNFLPEYYREWSKEWLMNLIWSILQIKEFIKDHPISLINAENYSPTSFFNIGIVVDTDGSIYGTNLMLSGDFESYKQDLKIGSVYSGITKNPFNEWFRTEYIALIEGVIKSTYPKNILRSVEYVDAIISELVTSYAKPKSHLKGTNNSRK